MWGEFSKAVNAIKPKVFIAENVLGLLSPKFEDFVKKYIIDTLRNVHETTSRSSSFLRSRPIIPFW
jgi:DNA (cytosine-5)-methyltransferase 1